MIIKIDWLTTAITIGANTQWGHIAATPGLANSNLQGHWGKLEWQADSIGNYPVLSGIQGNKIQYYDFDLNSHSVGKDTNTETLIDVLCFWSNIAKTQTCQDKSVQAFYKAKDGKTNLNLLCGSDTDLIKDNCALFPTRLLAWTIDSNTQLWNLVTYDSIPNRGSKRWVQDCLKTPSRSCNSAQHGRRGLSVQNLVANSIRWGMLEAGFTATTDLPDIKDVRTDSFGLQFFDFDLKFHIANVDIVVDYLQNDVFRYCFWSPSSLALDQWCKPPDNPLALAQMYPPKLGNEPLLLLCGNRRDLVDDGCALMPHHLLQWTQGQPDPSGQQRWGLSLVTIAEDWMKICAGKPAKACNKQTAST